MSSEPSITCPKCGRTSYHPEDIAQRYCGACKAFSEQQHDPEPSELELAATVLRWEAQRLRALHDTLDRTVTALAEENAARAATAGQLEVVAAWLQRQAEALVLRKRSAQGILPA